MDKINDAIGKMSKSVTDALLDNKSPEDLRKIQGIKDKVISIVADEGKIGLIGLQLANHELTFNKVKAVG